MNAMWGNEMRKNTSLNDVKEECRESDKRATGSTDNQSHQLAFQVKNEQLGGNGGKETSCFLLEIRELWHLLHQSCWRMQCLFQERKED